MDVLRWCWKRLCFQSHRVAMLSRAVRTRVLCREWFIHDVARLPWKSRWYKWMCLWESRAATIRLWFCEAYVPECSLAGSGLWFWISTAFASDTSQMLQEMEVIVHCSALWKSNTASGFHSTTFIFVKLENSFGCWRHVRAHAIHRKMSWMCSSPSTFMAPFNVRSGQGE